MDANDALADLIARCGEAIEPRLCLLGLAHRLRAWLAARRQKLLLQFERRQSELRPCLVGGLADLAEPVDDRAIAARICRSPL
jgi:hypothetical protein